MTVSKNSNGDMITMMQQVEQENQEDSQHSQDASDDERMATESSGEDSQVEGHVDDASSRNKHQHEDGDSDGDIESVRDRQNCTVSGNDDSDNDVGASGILETEQDNSHLGGCTDDVERKKELSSCASAVMTKETLNPLEDDAENDLGVCCVESTQLRHRQHIVVKEDSNDGDDDADSARSLSDRAAIHRRMAAPAPPSPSRSSSESSPVYERYEMDIKEKQRIQDGDDIYDVIESNTSASNHEFDTSGRYYSDDSKSHTDQNYPISTSAEAGPHHQSASSSAKRQSQRNHRRVSFNQKNLVQTSNHSNQTNTSSTHHHTRANVNTYSRGSISLSKEFCGGICHNTCCAKYHGIILPLVGMLLAIFLMMIVVSIILVYKNR